MIPPDPFSDRAVIDGPDVITVRDANFLWPGGDDFLFLIDQENPVPVVGPKRPVVAERHYLNDV